MSRDRVPVEDLVDLQSLEARGRPLTPRELRAALPRGWALDEDGRHAHRDARLLFREGWVLILGLLIFGGIGGAFLIDAMPRGWSGALRLAGVAGLTLLAGGIVGPMVTRALYRRR